MQKLMIATIGLSLSMGLAGAAIAAQPAQANGQMQSPNNGSEMSAPASSEATSGTPAAPSPQADPSTMQNNATAAPGMASGSGTPQSYPRCSRSVHDECRQR